MKPCLVLQADRWAIRNDKTGEIEREGYTLTYVDPESPQVGRRRGLEPMRISGSLDVVGAVMGSLPAYYELHYRMRANRETGKAEVQLSALRYVAPLVVPELDGQAGAIVAGEAFANDDLFRQDSEAVR